MNSFPCVEAVSYSLSHAPDLVRFGSKPAREVERDPALGESIKSSLRSFEHAAAYLPNRVFLGSSHPDSLGQQPQPWWQIEATPEPSHAAFGRLLCQTSLYGLLRCCDEFGIVSLGRQFSERARECLCGQELFSEKQLSPLDEGVSEGRLLTQTGQFKRIYLQSGEETVGSVRGDHESDETLQAPILLENLATKATALAATMELFSRHPEIAPETIDYVINTGEEAIGDRYQRGGGNLAKAVAETAGLSHATGSDLKAFCCGPMHGFVMAAALVQAGVFRRVLVIGGGSLAKLGMKFQAHIKSQMPILEDVLAGFAFLVGGPSSKNPSIRLDCLGKHDVRCQSSAQGIVEALVSEPLHKIGKTICDVEKFAVELQNPEITVPAGSGDVPATIYRVIASLAVIQKEIRREDFLTFIQQRGMLGYSPTQGHVASAIPFLGHAWREMREGRLGNTQLIGKGSLFLGRMTQLSDGISVLLEKS